MKAVSEVTIYVTEKEQITLEAALSLLNQMEDALYNVPGDSTLFQEVVSARQYLEILVDSDAIEIDNKN